MSTKSLRLVLEERERTKPQSDEEEDSEHEETTGHKKNLFELLNDECEDEKDQIEETHSVQESSNKKKNKRKKKNKKNKDTTQLEADKKPNEDEDIDSIIKEVNEFASNSSTKVSQDKGTIFKSCFTVEMRHLNPDNEVKRLFGNRILLNEKNNKKQRNVKRYQLITADFNKQSVLRKSGLSMDVVKKRDGKTEFVFVHSRSYQEAQKAFMEVVKSNNHENLIKLLEGYPFHIDALQQMSDLFRLQEDLQQATQSIEYALFVFEASFHPLFSLTSASSRLDYRRRENRSFFLVLFRHVCLLSNKSLHRTALEVAKLILSLSPDSDPLGILLMLDHLCLKAEQHCFLTRLYTEWHACKNLFQLPNFAFSTPLAYFFISKSSSSSSSSSSETSRSFDVVSREEAASKADEMLRDALLMYPCLLLRLLDKLSVQADAQVSSHAHFQQDFHSEPKALCMLLDLYIWRSGEVWKKEGVMEWMERNVRQVVNGWESFKDTAEYYKKLRTARYKGTPRNIYRHVVLSEARSVVPDIPEFLMSSVEGYDPLPPPDSIQAYDPTPSSDSRTGQSRSGFLSLFFQSLSPSFNQNDTTEGAERPGWVGHLVGGVRHLLHNDHGLFQRLYRRGEEDDEDGGDGGDDNDGDVPRRQNWDEEDASGGGEGSAREGGARGGGGREGGAGGGGGLRRRIINSGRAVDEDDVDNDNNDNSNNSNSNNDNDNNNNNNNDDVNGVGRDGS